MNASRLDIKLSITALHSSTSDRNFEYEGNQAALFDGLGAPPRVLSAAGECDPRNRWYQTERQSCDIGMCFLCFGCGDVAEICPSAGVFLPQKTGFPWGGYHLAALEIECQRRPMRLLWVGISANICNRSTNINFLHCERALLSLRVTFDLQRRSGWLMLHLPSLLPQRLELRVNCGRSRY